MGKKASTKVEQTSALKRDIAALVQGGNLLSDEDLIGSNDDDETAGQGGKNKKGDRLTAEDLSVQNNKPGLKKTPKAAKADTVVQHPTLQKMLRKATIQKTLRFSPLLYDEYEQMCTKRDIETNFNRHMNEALELLLDKYRS